MNGDYGEEQGKKISLDEDTVAVLYPKDSVFSEVTNFFYWKPFNIWAKGLAVESCDGAKCARQPVDQALRTLLKRCNFEGKIEGDPESLVSLVKCEEGVADITVMSEMAGLDNTNFRLHPDGRVEKADRAYNASKTLLVN